MPEPSSSLADTGIKFADIVGKIASIALKIDRTAEGVDAVIGPLAGFIPYYSQVMAVMKIADPIIAKIAAAAPIVSGGIEAARPIIEAGQESAPAVLAHVKELIALAFSNTPGAFVQVTAAQISDMQAMQFAATSMKSFFAANEFSPQDARFRGIGDVS